MISFPYTLLFFVLFSISIAAPSRHNRGPVSPGPQTLGYVFYTSSNHWDDTSNDILPVIHIQMLPENPEYVAVVEIATEMKYLNSELGEKILANKVFPVHMKLSVEGNIHPGLSISEQTDLWVNVSKRRIVPVEFVGRPENTLIVTVKDDFFSKFGKKLGTEITIATPKMGRHRSSSNPELL